MTEFFGGVDGVMKVLARVRAKEKAAAVKGLRLALRNVLNVSNRRVPHEFGDLERDGGISVDAELLRGAVSYGRSADTAEYAEVQHERMDLHHDSGRSAKFLEQAFAETREQSMEIIGAQIRTEIAT